MKKCYHRSLTPEVVNHVEGLCNAPGRRPAACAVCGDGAAPLSNLARGDACCLAHLSEYFLRDAARTADRRREIFYDPANLRILCPECAEFVDIARRRRSIAPQQQLFNAFFLKKIPDLGGAGAVSALLQVIINTPAIRDHFFGFHHSLVECPVERCPDCLLKRVISQVYSDCPMDISRILHRVLLAGKEQSGFSVERLTCVFTVLCNLYHSEGADTEGAVPAECDCILHRTFRGVGSETHRCTICEQASTARKPFVVLELPLAKDLRKALASYFASRTTQYCPTCAADALARTERAIVTHPAVLCLFIKRFRLTDGLRKITTKVYVPKQLQAQEKEYALYAFIVQKKAVASSFSCFLHLGTEWFEFTATRVRRCGRIDSSLKASSMLFFRRMTDA